MRKPTLREASTMPSADLFAALRISRVYSLTNSALRGRGGREGVGHCGSKQCMHCETAEAVLVCMHVECGILHMLHVACCMLYVACCMPHFVCCTLHAKRGADDAAATTRRHFRRASERASVDSHTCTRVRRRSRSGGARGCARRTESSRSSGPSGRAVPLGRCRKAVPPNRMVGRVQCHLRVQRTPPHPSARARARVAHTRSHARV